MTVESINNYKLISKTLATGGQPDENQLRSLSKSGYEAVINLGLSNAEYSVANEQTLIESQGMRYFHIPVSFTAPEIEKYFEFSAILNTLSTKKVFLHCAANKRVAVFLALFQIIEEKWPVKKAIKQLKMLWEPDAVWTAYMENVIRKCEESSDKTFDLGSASLNNRDTT